jgi:uroporphyrinogen decarboxylase
VNDLFLRACRGEPVERTPVWLMRQAGRSLPEYRKVRERVDFVTLCRTPELAVEVTIQPVDRLGVDAAILFSDILVPAECLGLGVSFEPGPVVDRPVRSEEHIESLRTDEPEQTVPFVYETLRLLRRELSGRVPVIGFAGAPLTLAAYLVEGRGSKDFSRFKELILGRPAAAHRLLEKVTTVTETYLEAQVRAGAQALQLFDTWAGLLDRTAYREFGLRYARRVLERLRPAGAPLIYFALHSAHLMSEIGDCGADVVGVDWRTELDVASERLGARFVLQGNLDPCTLLAPPPVIERRAEEILERGRELPGHVFNLGHGVLPQTPVEHLQTLVDVVKRGQPK